MREYEILKQHPEDRYTLDKPLRCEVWDDGKDSHVVCFPVPGYTYEDLDIEVEERTVSIIPRNLGSYNGADDGNQRTVFADISPVLYDQKFLLGEHMHVESAHVAHGILSIRLKREVPEEMKPRKIEIKNGDKPKSKKGNK